jgi:hypothetical protein
MGVRITLGLVLRCVFQTCGFTVVVKAFRCMGEVARTEIALSVAISFFCVIGLPDKSFGGCSILPNRI